MSKSGLVVTLLLAMVSVVMAGDDIPRTPEEIETWWRAGKTLPLETSKHYPFDELRIKDDTGINVLVDMAHRLGLNVSIRIAA